MTAAERAERTRAADELCAGRSTTAGCPDTGVALVAVGGYGRAGAGAVLSDLDVVLVHDDDVELGDVGRAGLVPALGLRRPTSTTRCAPSTEMLDRRPTPTCGSRPGMLDVRHLAGDPNLTLRLRTDDAHPVAARRARTGCRSCTRWSRLAARADRRAGRTLSVPDLKEAEGGLRDATVLKALVATWLVDVPHADLERCRHGAARRPRRRCTPSPAGPPTGSCRSTGTELAAARSAWRRPGTPPRCTCASSAGGSPTSRGWPGAGWTTC